MFLVRNRNRIVVAGLMLILLMSIAAAIDFLGGGSYRLPSV